jgi:hypothetical protein
VLPDTEGGYFEVVPVREGEEVSASELVDLKEIEPGVWYDATTREVHHRTAFIDTKTNKVLKTVRRHPKRPHKSLTYITTLLRPAYRLKKKSIAKNKATKISANKAKGLKAGAEHNPQDRACIRALLRTV